MIEFFVNRRQKGKTSRCIEVYKDLVKQDYDAVYFVHSNEQVKRVSQLMRDKEMDSFRVTSNVDVLFEYKPRNIVIDEYLFFKRKDQTDINDYLSTIFDKDAGYVYVETTSDRLYNRELLTLVSILRNCHINPMRLKSVIDKQYLEQLEILNSNLLTNPRTLLRSEQYNYSSLSMEEYKTEILGMLFDDEEDIQSSMKTIKASI